MGFSGGSYYASQFHVMNSATIKGAGLRAGGPYAFEYDFPGGKEFTTEDVQTYSIDVAKKNSDDGLIDNTSNLNGAPVCIRGGNLDT